MGSSSRFPAVTVMTPVFNAEMTVRAAVESILNQSFEGFEYIIVDDGSTDGTLDVLRSIRDERIQLVEGGRRGHGNALNEALRRSRTPYVANLDADDVSLPNRLELQWRFMEENPAVGILGSAYYRVFDNGEIVQRTYPLDDPAIRREMALYGPFCHSAVMYRKAALNAVGGYDETLQMHRDYELFIRIAAAGYRMATLAEPLVYHRKSAETYFIRSFSKKKRILSMLRLNFKAIRKLALPRWMYLRALGRLTWQTLPHAVRPAVRGAFSAIREQKVLPKRSGPEEASYGTRVSHPSLGPKAT